MNLVSRCSAGFVVLLLWVAPLQAQQTVGLFVHDQQAFAGYTLFGPRFSTTVFLIDNDGLPVHSWETFTDQGSIGYLLPGGNLLRAANLGPGTFGIRLQEFDWEGNVVWEYVLVDGQRRQHHDIAPLPNGNVLVVARETRTTAEAIAEGRNPLAIDDGQVRGDLLVEIQPLPPNGGQIVWEWRVWDHLIQDFDVTKNNFGVVADHPERIDINHGPTGADWTHVNSVDYDPLRDEVIISSRHFGELWIIDHGTTTAEAAGSGGDLLYRWGNPAAYGRGVSADQQLFGQHDAQRIPPGRPGEGNILVFNNGWFRPEGNFSTVEEIVPPMDETGHYVIEPDEPFGPVAPTWNYTAAPPGEFYSPIVSGAQRQPDGTTLICEGVAGRLFEVTPSGEVVWDYVNPVDANGPVSQGNPPVLNRVFKVRRYAADDPGLIGRELLPGDPLELFDPPAPVPQDTLRAARLSATEIEVEWDASTCASFDYHLLYGPLAEVSTHALSGGACGIGGSGNHVWTGVPAGSHYFLVVGVDDTGIYESSWGTTGAGVRRNATTASFLCGTTTKVVSATCP